MLNNLIQSSSHNASTPSKRGRLLSLIREFKKDERGINLVEFAFAAPFLMALMVGLSTVFEMENASGSVGKVTGTISDIISQSPSVDSFAVSNAFKAADVMLHKNSKFEAYVAGIQVTSDGDPVVLWATANSNLKKLSLPQPGDIYERLPNDLRGRQGFFVATHGQMSYTPLFGNAFLDKTDGIANFDYSNYFVPRVSITTLCNSCEQSYPDDDD